MAEGQRLFHCALCDIQLNGPATARQHYASSKHKKREAAVASSQSLQPTATTYPFTVNSPIAESDSKSLTAQNIAPPTALPSTSSSGINCNGCSLGSGTNKPLYVEVKAKDPSRPPLYVPVADSVLPSKEYDFNGVSGHCYVCSVELTSLAHANQHLAGQNHAKAKKRWETKKQTLSFQAELEAQAKPIAVCRPQMAAAAAAIADTASSSSIPVSSFALVPPEKPALVAQTGPMMGRDFVSRVQLFHCEVCNKSTNTLEQLELHKRSPAHLKKVERSSYLNSALNSSNSVVPSQYLTTHHPPADVVDSSTEELANRFFHLQTGKSVQFVSDDGSIWFPCNVCNKRMNTFEQLQIHERSPAHLKKAGLASSSSSQLSDTDNTVWHACPYCEKRLNSAMQLDMHVKSHGIVDEPPHCCASCNSHVASDVSTSRGHQLPRDTAPTPAKELTREEIVTEWKQLGKESNWGRCSPTPCSGVDATSSSASQRIKPVDEIKTETATTNIVHRLKQLVYDRNGAVSPNSSGGEETTEMLHIMMKENSKLNSLPCNFAVAAGVNTQTLVDRSYLSCRTSANGPAMKLIPKAEPTMQEASNYFSSTGKEVHRDIEPMDDIELDESMISHSCSYPNCNYHCDLCNAHNNSADSKVMHLTGNKHLKNLKKLNTSVNMADSKQPNPFGPAFTYYCDLCNVPFHTIKDMKKHETGQSHMVRMTRVPAPDRVLPDIILVDPNNENDFDVASLTVSAPRKYQVELYRKALIGDCVCFLPTGTGKTLVSVMLISRLLQLNPRHSVLFLVDKILLTLQQTEVVKREIGDKLFGRFNEKSQRLEQRKLRIAMLCGEKTDLDANSLWQHDVVVVTAAYYFNLMECGALRWTDNCLVVFDEVHHCLKNHPYNQVIQESKHHDLDPDRRPRVFGLTASPAGYEAGNSSSVVMLRELLTTVGVDRLIAVVDNVDELAEYQSNTDLIIREVVFTSDEQNLSRELRVYLLECIKQLSNCSDIASINPEFEAFFSGGVDIRTMAEKLNDEMVCWIIDSLELIKISDTADARNSRLAVAFLTAHIRVLGAALNSLESLGLDSAYQELAVLLNNSYMGSFVNAPAMDLPCSELQSLVNTYFAKTPGRVATPSVDPMQSATFKLLVEELISWWDERTADLVDQPERPIALVLIQQRSDAAKLAKYLEESKPLCDRNMRVVHIVGHGRGGADSCGMNVNAQSRVIGDVRRHVYNVIVATSVAEEGIDLPACELVVELDAPDTVRALVQIRGRARRRGSKFIAFCRNQQQRATLDALLEKEKQMGEAVLQFLR